MIKNITLLDLHGASQPGSSPARSHSSYYCLAYKRSKRTRRPATPSSFRAQLAPRANSGGRVSFPKLGHGGARRSGGEGVVGLRGSCGAAAASRGGGGGGPREVPRGVQLRGLAGGRRQPRHRRHPGLPRHRAPALRPDLLRLPHRAVLRRPPRRRFHWYVSRIAGFLCWRVSPF